jgi:threonine dehydrogenase-like Zn-dependent dehydrogenase
MRTATFHGEGRITVGDSSAPIPADGELIVRVRACALCGSELKQWRRGWPVTPGHEIAGVVDEPGHPRHGERVVVYIPVFCGRCEDCREGRTHLCADRVLIGWQRNGGYAERLVAPERCLLPVPDDIEDALAPLLLDTIGTTAHGVRLARRISPGGKALVLGAGPIGLGAVLVLASMDFGPVDVIDPVAYRMEVAASLGARPTNPKAAAAGRYRIVIEASGKDSGRQLALEAIGPEGVVVQIGESESWSIAETRSIRLKDFFLVRSFYFPIADYAENLDILRAHKADFSRLVDAQVPLDGLPQLFEDFAAGQRLKPMVHPA